MLLEEPSWQLIRKGLKMGENNYICVISGILGQLASYLATLLLSKGYKVVGIQRRSSSPDYTNILSLIDNPNFTIEQGDVTDFGSIARIVDQYKPDEFYNLAAQSFVSASWTQPIATCEVDFMGVCNCLEAIRLFSPKTKFLQNGSSERFGDVTSSIQNENTECRPRSPYAAAKCGAEYLVKVYKESYNLFACNSICFNFESKFRGKEFVTRKITNWIGINFGIVEKFILERLAQNMSITTEDAFKFALTRGAITPLKLGNLDASRDWSHASDIANGIWLMLQQESPDTFLFASGKTRTIKEFLTAAFNDIGVSDWTPYVQVDPKFYRPAEVNLLCGDSLKAKTLLKWNPVITFEALVKEMVQNDIALNQAK